MSNDLAVRLRRFTSMMAPHQRTRAGGLLIAEAIDEIERLQTALAAERERCAQLFDVPAGINGEAEDWARAAAARIRGVLS